MQGSLQGTGVVVRTSNYLVLSRCLLAKTTSKNWMRAARAARFIFLIQPIKLLILRLSSSFPKFQSDMVTKQHRTNPSGRSHHEQKI